MPVSLTLFDRCPARLTLNTDAPDEARGIWFPSRMVVHLALPDVFPTSAGRSGLCPIE